MRLPVLRRGVIFAALVLIASSAATQSLADVARKEEKRRNGARTSSKILTNADLAADPRALEPITESATPAPPPPVATAATLTPPPAPGNASVAGATPAAPRTEELDEQLWRRRAAEYRARLAKAQQDVKSLSAAAHKDPREQARAEALLEKAQVTLNRTEDALRLFEMQADVARVPKNWIQ